MTKNTIPKALKRQHDLVQQIAPLSLRIERLVAQLHIQPIVSDPTLELARSLHGAVEDLRRSLALENARAMENVRAMVSPLEDIRMVGAELHKRFRLPEPVEFPKLLPSIKMDAASGIVVPYKDLEASLANTMKALSTPWLNTQHEIRSITGVAGLNQLGQILQTGPTLEIAAAKRLRSLLGDWRRKIDWPAEIFTDPLARSDFYFDLGLQPALTEFPAEAFHEALTIAGIKGGRVPLSDPHKRAHDQQEDEHETKFERNNTAHNCLQRFETQMRQFISEQLEYNIGENWLEDRIPPDIVKEWKYKQKTARDKGEPPQPLIEYADFTDYQRIIENKNNWNDVFLRFFRRKTSVQESLQRLYPIRVCTMHARLITQDDELYLWAETRRLSLAMEQSKRPEEREEQHD